jgi:hypothetical protein
VEPSSSVVIETGTSNWVSLDEVEGGVLRSRAVTFSLNNGSQLHNARGIPPITGTTPPYRLVNPQRFKSAERR